MSEKPHDYDALPTLPNAPNFRRELRVVGVVVVFVLLLEGLARYLAPTLDYDRVHIHDFPRLVEEMPGKGEGKERVLFYGNSLMMHGFDEAQVRAAMGDGEERVSMTKVTPVGTAILDWVYLYSQYFEQQGKHPDVIVVGFVRHHVSDGEKIKLRRLARHFVSARDLPGLWREDLPETHDRVQSVLANFSALLGDQPEHQLGILSTVVPDYQRGVNLNNQWIRANAEKQAALRAERKGMKVEADEEFKRVKRFMEMAKRNGVEVWFVPMPQPEFYELEPKLREVVEGEGMVWLDARAIEGMGEKDFSDGYHLGKTGTGKFSAWLGGELEKRLK